MAARVVVAAGQPGGAESTLQCFDVVGEPGGRGGGAEGELLRPCGQPVPAGIQAMYMDVHFTATGATVIYALDINCAKHPIRGREKEGLVNAWAVGADGSLSLINSVPCGGITPCHCQLLRPPPGERGQTLLLVANYGDEASGAPGLVSVFPILPSGELSPAAASRTVLEAAAGAASPEDAPRQLAPHPHMVTTDPDGDTVYLIDLGVNAILGYRLTRDPIELSHEPVVKCVLHGGAGPRHLVSRQSIAGIWVAFFQECQQ